MLPTSIYLAHTGFWGAFVGTVLLARAATGRESPARTSAPRVMDAHSGRYSGALILLHTIGFFLLYGGIGARVFGAGTEPQGRPLAGLLVIALGAGLSCWALLYLRSWRLRARLEVGHELATGGPFRLLRHPIYMAFDLLALGSALWLPSPTLWAAAVLMAVGGDLRARGEETLLLCAFGEAYAEYCRHVRRFVPGVY